jgi:hypothetical protein
MPTINRQHNSNDLQDCDCGNPANNTPGTVVDSVTGQCVPPCSDGTRPANGQNVGELLTDDPYYRSCSGPMYSAGMSTMTKMLLAAGAVGAFLIFGKRGKGRRR